MTKEEILQLRLEVKRNNAEISLTEKLLEQRRKLNEIKKRKVESTKKEFETTEKDCELQDKLENAQIRRVQKHKQNVLRMKKALGINTQVEQLSSPVKENVINIKPVVSETVEENKGDIQSHYGDINYSDENVIAIPVGPPEKKKF